MCYVHFLASRPLHETPNFKQHVAGIEVSGLFDLKRTMLSLPLALADIISRRSPMLETLIWAETERGGDAGGPDLSRKYYKLSFIP